MERHTILDTFIVLKPLCISLMKTPDMEILKRITTCVNCLSDKVVQDISEHLLRPMLLHLRNDHLSKDTKENLVQAMRSIIKKAKIKKINDFIEIYSVLLVQIYEKNKPTILIPSHEELKEAVVLCIKDLIYQCFTEVHEALYSRKYVPKLSYGTYLCLSIASYEKSQSLRLAAIETIMALCQVDENSDKSDITLQNQVADSVMLFLPGVAIGLQKIATGTDIQSHKITMMAVRAWARIISLVMQDKSDESVAFLDDTQKEENTSTPLENVSHLKEFPEIEKLLKTTFRSQKWLNATADRLNVIVRELDSLKKHPHYKVRKELVSSIGLLLTSCARNMKPNVMELIELLISLHEDDAIEVNKEAKNVLDTINKSYVKNINMRPLIELLEEGFYKLLTTLPRVIRSSDDREQLSCLNHVAGYLRLLGKDRLSIFLQSLAHLRRLLMALVYIIKIDSSNISLLEDVGIKDLDSEHYYQTYLWKQFKFIQDTACKEKISIICELLGKNGDLKLLVENIFEIISEAPDHRKELIYLLNTITNVPVEDTNILPLYKDIVEYYICEELWYLPIQVTENVPLCVAQSNVIQCCLLTEGLGLIAKNLKHHYERFLLKTLYLIIERAGNTHSLISSVGVQTLQNIAESQKHNTIGDLLRANVDYFSYHVTIKLRRIERNPGVLDVIAVVLNYSSLNVLPCLKEIVQDILLQLNMTFQKQNTYSFLKVFYTFILCIRKLVIGENINKTELESVSIQEKPSEVVIRNFLEYYEAKSVDKKIEEEDFNYADEDVLDNVQEKECIDDSECCNEQDEETLNLPAHIQMVENVLKCCLNFLSHKEIKVSLISMLILAEGLPMLTKWENQLLPIVHQLWHPLVDRFYDKNVLIINRAWQLLCMLACISKDFIRSRTIKQILPAISTFLKNSAKESLNKSHNISYKFTQTFKLQKQLLCGLGCIAKDLILLEKELWEILTITEPYLNAQQHSLLQACCVAMYKDIADYNGDIVLVKCLSIWYDKIARIPSDETFCIKMLKEMKFTIPNNYHTNVETIITYIQAKFLRYGNSNVKCD